MTDGEALLRAILENPADDTARLVYADWLEENGEAKAAEYIRTGVEICAIWWDANRSAHRLRRLRKRDRELSEGPFPHIATPPGVGIVVHRSFVAAVSLTLADFLTHAGELFSRHPIERVTLRDRDPLDLGYGWSWVCGPPDAARSCLPRELYHEDGGEDDDTRWVWASRDDCYRALSLRCVARGRFIAGLPPLAAEAAPWA